MRTYASHEYRNLLTPKFLVIEFVGLITFIVAVYMQM
jgi:preprotein translocase subunit Sss1